MAVGLVMVVMVDLAVAVGLVMVVMVDLAVAVGLVRLVLVLWVSGSVVWVHLVVLVWGLAIHLVHLCLLMMWGSVSH